MNVIKFNGKKFGVRKVSVLQQPNSTDQLYIYVDTADVLDEVLGKDTPARECFDDVCFKTDITHGKGLELAKALGLNVDESLGLR